MEGSLKGFTLKINNAGDKTKKYADIYYLVSLFVFISAVACTRSRIILDVIPTILIIAEMMLLPIVVYRIIFTLFRNWKTAVAAIALIVFSFVYSGINEDTVPFTFIAFAIVGGIGVCADKVLLAGIGGNAVMIIYNICMTLFDNKTLTFNDYQDRKFFYFGPNVFYLDKMNNCSSTDFAAHYFWVIAAYLWVRGKKITWGEIFALGALDVLVYSLTGSNTSFLCIGLLLICAFVLKLLQLFDKKIRLPEGIKKGNVFDKTIPFLGKTSYLTIGLACILLTVFYDVENAKFRKLNDILHWRLGLGHRGFLENGIHLIAGEVTLYGMSSSADGFFNFLDCSFVDIIITGGILMFVLFMTIMTTVQIKHKKYIYGVAILSVCALSCIEEHHLSEISYNLFLLLLFADFEADKKTSPVIDAKKPVRKILNYSSFAVCAGFLVVSVFLNLPRYRTVKELDRLDVRAGEICRAVQSNLDAAVSSGTWHQVTEELDSYQYGDLLAHPSDFEAVTGTHWNEMTDDPKDHAYYVLYYSPSNQLEDKMLDVMITDEVRSLIGGGSIVIEYDVVKGKVYGLWYAESEGCYAIDDGRKSDRTGRLGRNALMLEGYYSGARHG